MYLRKITLLTLSLALLRLYSCTNKPTVISGSFDQDVDFVLLSNAEVDICHEAFLDTNIGATQLDNNAMKDVIGGETVGRLVCDRNTGVAIYVPNCVNRNKKCSDFGKKNYSGNGNSLCSNFGNNSAVTVVLN